MAAVNRAIRVERRRCCARHARLPTIGLHVGRERRDSRQVVAGVILSPQRGLDLAVDALKLGGKIPHRRPQAVFAMIHDPPQLGALRGAEMLVGKPDPGLHDFAAPRLRARMDVFDGWLWHALAPRRAASGETMPR
jgi:hypothetical protein